jgi:hypothetical protein
MADRSSTPAESLTTGSSLWLMEHYRPGADVAELRHRLARLREAVVRFDRTGESVQVVAAAIVPTDEGFVCMLRAPSRQSVRDLCRRSRIRLDRLTLALPDQPPGTEDQDPCVPQ